MLLTSCAKTRRAQDDTHNRMHVLHVCTYLYIYIDFPLFGFMCMYAYVHIHMCRHVNMFKYVCMRAGMQA